MKTPTADAIYVSRTEKAHGRCPRCKHVVYNNLPGNVCAHCDNDVAFAIADNDDALAAWRTAVHAARAAWLTTSNAHARADDDARAARASRAAATAAYAAWRTAEARVDRADRVLRAAK